MRHLACRGARNHTPVGAPAVTLPSGATLTTLSLWVIRLAFPSAGPAATSASAASTKDTRQAGRARVPILLMLMRPPSSGSPSAGTPRTSPREHRLRASRQPPHWEYPREARGLTRRKRLLSRYQRC